MPMLVEHSSAGTPPRPPKRPTAVGGAPTPEPEPRSAPLDLVAAQEVSREVGAQKIEVRRIAIERLRLDPIRPLRNYWVQRLRRSFDPAKLGILHVSKRDNGDLVVIEGNHRIAAARLLGDSRLTVTCIVYSGLSVAREAALYRGLESKLRQTQLDLFLARRQEGEPVACEIDALTTGLGIAIKSGSGGSGPPALAAIGRVERIYAQHGPAVLRRVLLIAKTAWQMQRNAFDGHLLGGLARFLSIYGEQIDERHLVERLSVVSPNEVRHQGRVIMAALGLSSTDSLGEGNGRAIFNLYNHGLRGKKLPDWPQRRTEEPAPHEQ